MQEKSRVLLKKHFEENSLVESDLESFNHLIDVELQKIIDENREIEPTIIPPDVEEYKIRFNKIWIDTSEKDGEVGGPVIIEADGSKRKIFPLEARLRKITYAAPIFLEVSAHINGVQRESFTIQIGNLPIMLKSKFCHLNGMSREELIQHGEDPDDPGGYFIINGTEKVIVNIEDLISNKAMMERSSLASGPKVIAKMFSESGSFKIPHIVEKLNDGIYYMSFTRVKRVPVVVVLKALGLLKDEDIVNFISRDRQFDDIFMNLYEFIEIKTQEDAMDYIAKRVGITQAKEVRIERMKEILHKYFLPHLGLTPADNIVKAYNLCKMLKQYMLCLNGEVSVDDKDHYMNKRIKCPGDLLADVIRVNIKVLISDMLYNFQRIVKRGKFPSIRVTIREKLLTSRLYSAMATGNWVGGRKGVSQRIERVNFLQTMSLLQRVISPLSASQENFEARALHPTHFGKLCPVETPEGTNIGLRKNLALFCKISEGAEDNKVIESLKHLNLKRPGALELPR
ncbi:MAG: DNA-directed RNA polymerase subunit B'' [Candidatus Woesearchaeota archaeon]